ARGSVEEDFSGGILSVVVLVAIDHDLRKLRPRCTALKRDLNHVGRAVGAAGGFQIDRPQMNVWKRIGRQRFAIFKLLKPRDAQASAATEPVWPVNSDTI